MANVRFPENLDGSNDPWVVFTSQQAQYSRRNRSVGEILVDGNIGNSVALYFPTGFAVADSLNYESAEEGIGGMVANKLMNQGVKTTALSAIDFENVATAAGATGRSLLRSLPAGAGRVIARNQRRVTNPREFMLFSSPNIREFSFSFVFVPQSKQEADMVPEIIKFFRRSAYPQETALEYILPDTFNVAYKQANDGIIKLPELACTSIGVTYNPNSISFFRDNGMPVETNLELSFTELKPINRSLVNEGY